jgi:hypothetical protein
VSSLDKVRLFMETAEDGEFDLSKLRELARSAVTSSRTSVPLKLST